jgi:hypothetical protein
MPLDDNIIGIKDDLARLQHHVDTKNHGGSTTQPRKTETKAPPGDDHTHHLDNLSNFQMLSKAGYQLLPEIEVKGWTPFNPVRSSSIQVYTAPLNSTMIATVDCLPCNQQSCRKVIFKFVEQDEFDMHSSEEPHGPYPRRLHMPMRSREAHRHGGGSGVKQRACPNPQAIALHASFLKAPIHTPPPGGPS